MQFTQAFVLPHMVLEMASQVAFEQLTLPDDVVTRASHHLGDPGEELVEPVILDHPV